MPGTAYSVAGNVMELVQGNAEMYSGGGPSMQGTVMCAGDFGSYSDRAVPVGIASVDHLVNGDVQIG